jgi:hypothetical protein
MSLKVQSILFPRQKFSRIESETWLKQNNFKIKKIDITPRFYRYRQLNPIAIKKKSFITKQLDNDVILIMGKTRS